MDAAILDRGEKRSWLANPTVLLCIVGVLLPNALSLGAYLLGIGIPPRPTMVAAYALVAVLARHVSPLTTVIVYLATALYDAASTVALITNLGIKDIVFAVHLMGELNLFKSPLYVTMAIASLAVVGTNILLLTTKRETLRRSNAVVMLSVAAVFGVGDFVGHASPHYTFGSIYAAGKPMDSGVLASGFGKAALAARDRHVLLVVVEALGQFDDPAKRALIANAIKTADVLGRYQLSEGTSAYYGSTTAAEMRELCATRDSYGALLERKTVTCLPEQMAANGYRTVSLHGFMAKLFRRAEWYPLIGFEKRIFGEDLNAQTVPSCGGPFRGPCDKHLIPILENEIRAASAPTFFYWLTLSTHAPVMPREGTPRLGCDANGGKIGRADVCYMTEMWIDVFEGLAGMLSRLPPMEVLLVGDHAPPIWWKESRDLFQVGRVPWFRLTPKSAPAASAKAP